MTPYYDGGLKYCNVSLVLVAVWFFAKVAQCCDSSSFLGLFCLCTSILSGESNDLTSNFNLIWLFRTERVYLRVQILALN